MDILLGTNCQSCCKMKPVTHFPAWIFLLLFCLALIFFFKTNGTKQKWHDHIKRKIIKKNVSLSLFFFAIEVSRPFTAVKSLKHSSKTCKKKWERWKLREKWDLWRVPPTLAMKMFAALKTEHFVLVISHQGQYYYYLCLVRIRG